MFFHVCITDDTESVLNISILEFIGAFLAAVLVYGIYYDGINRFDGGKRQVCISQFLVRLFSIDLTNV